MGHIDILVNDLLKGLVSVVRVIWKLKNYLWLLILCPDPILAAHVTGTDEIFPWSGVSTQINVHPAGVRPVYISSLSEVVSCPWLVHPLWDFSTLWHCNTSINIKNKGCIPGHLAGLTEEAGTSVFRESWKQPVLRQWLKWLHFLHSLGEHKWWCNLLRGERIDWGKDNAI